MYAANMHKETRHLLKAIEAQGFTVQRAGNGHYKVRNAAGEIVAILSATPSDWRSRKNELSRLRRAGFRG